MKLAKGTLWLMLGMVILMTSNLTAADRMVLGEFFTNTSCGPCYQPEQVLDQLAETESEFFAVIRYHVWWPSNADPYYRFNVSENTARNNYYGNGYTPHLFIDGNIDGHEQSGPWAGLIENEYANYSPLIIRLYGSYNPDNDTGTVTVNILAEQNPGLTNLKLRVALTETAIRWNAPNGVSLHNQTFRDMMPAAAGEAVTLAEGDTIEYTYTFATVNPINNSNCEIIAFVQSDQNRYVLQAAKISVSNLNQVGIDDPPTVPQVFSVAQNYPNPFNAKTLINFNLPLAGQVAVNIYSITGQLIETLGGYFEAGNQSIIWDASKATSGIYFYKISSGDHSQTMKMTLVK
jgi:hypothetical protein